MHVVTGSSGFIGSRLVTRLTQSGHLVSLIDASTKDQFLEALEAGSYGRRIRVILHQGACSDTLENNYQFMVENNFTYTKRLFEWCQKARVPLIYASSASVYGMGDHGFRVDPTCEHPLNIYAESKLLVDQFVRSRIQIPGSQVVGLRYFNVYGPGEQKKGRMASVAYQAYQQFKTEGRVVLFEGDFRRDFVYVDDVVSVIRYFLENRGLSGIWNVGTGRAQPFSDVATAVINAVSGTNASCAELEAAGLIAYKPIPAELIGRYQPFTQADIRPLREAGYAAEFKTVQQGCAEYVRELNAAISRS